MKKTQQTVEIMAPAGSWEALRAALQAGANSVYFGVEQLHMRAGSTQAFSLEDLPTIAEQCKLSNTKSYLTLNSVLYNHDLKIMRKICDCAKAAGISAVIASDVAAIQYAHSIAFPVHISTQANVCNVEALKFFAPFSDVVVLARELTLGQIKEICATIQEENIRGKNGELIKVEIFVHGALCVAVSGKCFMSLATQNASANRGACLQNCRRAYRVIDEETGEELLLENKYVMSPKDLCCIGFIDQIIASGVSVFKIEGRGRAPEYVFKTTKAYHEAVESVLNGTYTPEKIAAWTHELETVFNRGFWHGGYYLGKQLGEWSGDYGSQATQVKSYVGKVQKYYPKVQVAEFLIEADAIYLNDEIIITGKTTGLVQSKIESMRVNDLPAAKAERGAVVTFPLSKPIHHNDKLYVIKAAPQQVRVS